MFRLVPNPHYLFTKLNDRLYVGPLGLVLVPVFLALNQFVVRINVILRNVYSAGVMMLTLIRNLLQRQLTLGGEKPVDQQFGRVGMRRLIHQANGAAACADAAALFPISRYKIVHRQSLLSRPR